MTPSVKDNLLDAILPHVVFDGWGKASFDAAVTDVGIKPVVAHAHCPRGATDLALHYHKRCDARMVQELEQTDLPEMRFRDRVALAVKLRLQVIDNKEAVRRAVTLFSLPTLAPDGTKAVWDSVDLIWRTLGDRSDDVNWYTKRATLSGVYGSTLLYWLGDDSDGNERTWDFLDRRIDNVMQFEKAKARVKALPGMGALAGAAERVFGTIKAPHRATGQPGRMNASD
ncbi:COQ9 family protein [Qingshengfaniella alkalisoli]|uniref:COQ9 family protein n=2 Tax=Qingshengfaniella alkalisoli TaxID=2599296 RepID=A0A5B8I8U2_9RHOB|nr:COQ9 family protein [Qingshengfaniella alkalisoli]QDY70219.1 COQ9 family protein [Qingshengfaniella alkalisoli]